MLILFVFKHITHNICHDYPPDENILTVVDLNYFFWKRNIKNAVFYKILFTLDGMYSKQYSATDHIENIMTF